MNTKIKTLFDVFTKKNALQMKEYYFEKVMKSYIPY